MMHASRPLLRGLPLVALPLLAVLTACGSDSTSTPAPGSDGSTPGADGAGGGGGDLVMAGPGIDTVPLSDTILAAGLGAPVDVVRDEWGVPHIYGQSQADVFFAQGYITAMDRLVQMDILRHTAEGTIAELVGTLSGAALDQDLVFRAHHMRSTAQASWEQLKASNSVEDQRFVAALGRYAAGINAYVADLNAGKYKIPTFLSLFYNAAMFRPWSEVDAIQLLAFETFYFNYSAASEIALTQVMAGAKAQFDQSNLPERLARKGIGADLFRLSPLDPTHTIDGWTGMNGDTSRASLPFSDPDGNMMALLGADLSSIARVARPDGIDSAASNNWVIAPKLTATGHAMLANDTHVPLQNPSIWYLVHVVSRGSDAFDAYGESMAGVPAIVLGTNQHVSWGATTDQMDLTDVYRETVVACDGPTAPCVVWNGKKVPLTSRMEKFDIGASGKIDHTVTAFYYDVPHHGPIIPRVKAGALEPLGQTELSVRYVGYEPELLIRALDGVLRARSVADIQAAIDRDNHTAAFNWVAADDQGHIGWTQYAKVPRRAASAAPYLILPGDGTAEWGADLDPKYIPHSWDPAKGYLVTANADPIGVSDDNEPFFSEPMVDGAPLYTAWEFVDGARAGRITRRITDMANAQKKISLDDMQSIQADTVSEHAQALGPTLLATLTAMGEELAKPGMHPDIADVIKGAPANVTAKLADMTALIKGWTSFETPSGAAEEAPTATQIADSRAALLFNAWVARFLELTFDDEVKVVGASGGTSNLVKTLALACDKAKWKQLSSGLSSAGDPVLFDDLATPAVETQLNVSSHAVLDALGYLLSKVDADPSKWRWGAQHTLTLDFFLIALDQLKIPQPTDANYPHGFPRHGAAQTVDPGGGYESTAGNTAYDFSYAHGPGIRFVADMDPSGPKVRNVIPGGETFDPGSPHYADQMELWRKNTTYDVPLKDAEVIKSAMTEQSQRKIGRIRFAPK